MDCVFCDIVQGKIPANMVYQNTHATAFLDIRPINKGHALVVPKEHYADLFATPPLVLHAMIDAVQKVANAVKKGMHTDGINIGMNNGGAAGQVVFHAHMHIIPRFSNDGLRHWESKTYAEGEIKVTEEKIKKFMDKDE